MKRTLFIDRDGTIIKEPPDEQVDSLEKLEFVPGVITALAKIATQTDYELVMVTNQDGLGTELFPEETFWPAHNKMLKILEGEGIRFSEIFIDRSLPEEKAPTRKPGTALLTKYLSQGIDLKSSYVIGDRLTDVELAKNLGCKAILFGGRKSDYASLCTSDWDEIFRYITGLNRKAIEEYITGETKITAEVNLDGTGKIEADTGIGFFNHMLSQIARHGNIDIKLKAEGDLDVDEHHTIEDSAIALGRAVARALASRKGIERFGFTVPMDDSLANVAIDLSGRPWLVWDVTFTREKIGDMPSEMVFHFFKTFADNAGCNINVKAEGSNEHHKAEAIFKAFGKALGMAVNKTGRGDIPSTKGKL
ncbi:MAG TPA: bifunctional histidinol-phosphatase/imidazoleglycerol-phosphate dehydratase HisB [Bacteroidales bacterium]|nr:bifunctional histidinol-phosphatase/imidazoleglycerol-phosphate dehydratase HisB [Bacteroidales bacterium]HRR15715.1 bifunctional histidinol-phosphatase/imidazoleglycerol-phosphate dehydratase HisB [Bacteroidales bacterium]HRT47465.1 bifunctional histidinol-phosphatase/imidazoleglycerol-phosphate dehydratase HisB [Bacteroidales bacterium]HRU56033.1 bifunctional histidinol-phosphatase/imidazoleglycerol-phosphate dehydratase HisB [Bacteroidales bacterium]